MEFDVQLHMTQMAFAPCDDGSIFGSECGDIVDAGEELQICNRDSPTSRNTNASKQSIADRIGKSLKMCLQSSPKDN